MKRLTLVILPLALLLVGGTALLTASPVKPRAKGGIPVPKDGNYQKLLNSAYTQAELNQGTYVGSYTCLGCHADAAEQLETKHQQFIRRPMAKWTLTSGWGVMANQAGGAKDDFIVGLDLNGSDAFSAQKPNAPVLSYDASSDTYFMTVGTVKMRVIATLAGYTGGGQRYMVRIPVSDTSTGWSHSIYFAPATYDDSAKKWSPNSASTWWTGNTPVLVTPVRSSAIVTDAFQGQNYMKTCSGCHITGIKAVGKWPNSEYMVKAYPAFLYPDDSPYFPDLNGDGRPALADIGCEMCHGPGSAHVAGGGDVTKIVNPSKVVAGPGYAQDNQAQSATCLQCHVQVASVPNKTWGFPYNETANKPFRMTNPPDDLTKYQIFTGGKWPDGVHFIYGRIDSYRNSAHYQGSHGIACFDCHDAMALTQNDSQVLDSIARGGTTYPNTNVDDDSFCLSCHHAPYFLPAVTGQMVVDWKTPGFEAPIPDAIRNAIESHTHHPYGAANPDGSPRSLGQSRCITCHMAPEEGHGDVSGASHVFLPSRPQDTIAYKDVTGLSFGGTGNVNSCASSCHRNQVRIWTDVPIDNSSPNNKFGVGYMSGAPVTLANYLVQYFGPEGIWWKTEARSKK